MKILLLLKKPILNFPYAWKIFNTSKPCVGNFKTSKSYFFIKNL